MYPRPSLQPHSPMIYAYGSQSSLPDIRNFSTRIMHNNANTTSTFYVVKIDSKLTHGNFLNGETAQKLGILQFALSSSMQANVTKINVCEQFPKLSADGAGKMSTSKSSFISTRRCSQCSSDTDVFYFMSEKMLWPNSTDWRNWISLRRSMVQLHGSARSLCRKLMEELDYASTCGNPTKPSMIKREKHIMPTLDDWISDVNGSTVFSKLDLSSAYHQLETDEASRQVRTFTTHAGIPRYKYLLFGVNAAAEMFQNTIAQRLSDIPSVQTCQNTQEGHWNRRCFTPRNSEDKKAAQRESLVFWDRQQTWTGGQIRHSVSGVCTQSCSAWTAFHDNTIMVGSCSRLCRSLPIRAIPSCRHWWE